MPLTSDPQASHDDSRRKALKALAFVAVGACVALVSSGRLASLSGAQSEGVASGSAAPTVEEGSSATYSRVKVRYFQMSATLPDISEEYYVLPNPANYSELLRSVLGVHPVLNTMMTSMLVLVDGAVASNTTTLKEGDEVDFIPSMSGG